MERKFECRICISDSSESAISLALEKALPAMQWEEGDSVWDKIRVWGKGPDATVRIYRYESPGPFNLTIILETPEGTDAEEAYLALRGRVLRALNATVWKPLEPQPVSLIKPEGRFPDAYEFDCDLDLWKIKGILDDADFWYWEALKQQPLGLYLEGRIPFRIAGQFTWGLKERIRIAGDKPSYTIEVVHWQDEASRVPTCDQVHETIQNTILPAIWARNVRGRFT